MKSAGFIVVLCLLAGGARGGTNDASFTSTFETNVADFASSGTSDYFVLLPGYVLELRGSEGGRATALTVTVLDETRLIAGVETRVVEERETADGAPVEISRNYFAISRATGNVYYFGEDVDAYADGHVAGHEGSWHAGEHGATFGLMMPGRPAVGDRFYQERAPGVALDRAEIVDLAAALDTPAGAFTNCLKTEETSALEPGHEFKLHAPGIGLIQDEDLVLVHHGFR